MGQVIDTALVRLQEDGWELTVITPDLSHVYNEGVVVCVKTWDHLHAEVSWEDGPWAATADWEKILRMIRYAVNSGNPLREAVRAIVDGWRRDCTELRPVEAD